MSIDRRRRLHDYGPLVLILVLYLLLGSLFAILTPPWQTPDEPAHFNYLRHVATTGRLPILQEGDYDQAYLEEIKARKFPPDMPVDSIRYEGHQPPLYYWLLSPIYVLGNGLGRENQLTILRLFGVLLGAGVIYLIWASTRRLFPDQVFLAHLAAGFAGFLPMHVAMMASINNDALAELIIAMGIYRLLGHLKHPEWEAKSWLGTGIIVGLGCLTKFQAYILLPLTGFVWLWVVWIQRARGERSSHSWFTGLAWIAPSLLIPLAWWFRNTITYGLTDPLGLYWHDAIVIGQPRTVDWIATYGWSPYLERYVNFTFRSFWGVFGWLGVFMDSRVYMMLLVLSVLVLAGFIWQLRRLIKGQVILTSFQKRGLILLGLQVLIVTITYVWYNLDFVQHQGRYLFPALLPLSVSFAVGLSGLFSSEGSRWGALAAILLFGLVLALGLWAGDLNKWALLLTLLAVVVLGLHSRYYYIPRTVLAIGTLALMFLINLYALFGALIPQLG